MSGVKWRKKNNGENLISPSGKSLSYGSDLTYYTEIKNRS
nr:MAG TPA: hypothetical protein [Caudoviricetes sp.]